MPFDLKHEIKEIILKYFSTLLNFIWRQINRDHSMVHFTKRADILVYQTVIWSDIAKKTHSYKKWITHVHIMVSHYGAH